eukprot:scaffold285733_cov53-Attheya_sp.AAC.1
MEMIVDCPIEDQGKADLYLDDGAQSINDNLNRAAAAIPLAVHIVGRPRSGNEPIPREELLALKKLTAEGGLAEAQVFLGWIFDLRQLLVKLPPPKFAAWSSTIIAIVDRGDTTFAEMKTLLGRLEHLCVMFPSGRHFLSRLRFLRERYLKNRTTKVIEDELEDLALMLVFLHKVHRGVNMNLLTFRRPEIVL